VVTLSPYNTCRLSKKNSKVYAFIDAQNLNLGIRQNGWRLDYRKFRLYLKNKYNVEKAFLFIGYLPEQEKLYKALRTYGFKLIFKPVLKIKKHGRTIIKGNVDAELVLHTMIRLNDFDKAIIVSGDGDFYCLIEYLVTNNKLLRILVPNKNYSRLLKKFHKYIVRLDLLRGNLALRKPAEVSGRSRP